MTSLRTAWILLGALLIGLSSLSQAKTISKIESFGVYVAGQKGYVQVTPYNHDGRYVDFQFLHELPNVLRKSDQVKLIVYSNKFEQSHYAFEVRPIDTTIKIDEVSFSVKPLKTKDMYEFTLNKPIKDGHMLHIHAPDVLGYYKMGAVVLGDTEQELVKYFSNKKLDKAYAVHQYLEDALKAYPKSKSLKALLPYWAKARKDEKDIKTYGYVDEQWRKYNDATKIHLKARYLRSMLGEISGYLRDYPDGKNAAEAKTRKAYAEKKLKEYEPLL